MIAPAPSVLSENPSDVVPVAVVASGAVIIAILAFVVAVLEIAVGTSNAHEDGSAVDAAIVVVMASNVVVVLLFSVRVVDVNVEMLKTHAFVTLWLMCQGGNC